MRRSVCSPATCSATLASVATWQAAQDFPHAGEESQRSENQREPGLRVQPAVQEISHGDSNSDGANQSKRQFQGERRKRSKIFGFLWCSRRRLTFVLLMVRR